MIHFNKVQFAYEGSDYRLAADIVLDSRVIGILGMNGAGKSTFMNLLCGILHPQEGTIQLFEDRLVFFKDHDLIKRRMFYLPVDDFLFEELSLDQNMRLFCDMRFGRRGEYLKYADYLQAFGLEKYLKTRFGECSTGTRKKVQIFLALTCQARILVLDEPYNGLDIMSIFELNAILNSAAFAGCTLVISSHIVDLVERMAEQVLILHNGAVIDLLKKPFGERLEDLYIEKVNGNRECVPSPL